MNFKIKETSNKHLQDTAQAIYLDDTVYFRT